MKIKGIALLSNTPGSQAQVGVPVEVNPPSPQAESSHAMLLTLAVWSIVALLGSRFLGVFRRTSVHGPERLRGDESVWWLLMILCAAILIGGKLAPLFMGFDFQLPAESLPLLSNVISESLVFLAIIGLSLFVRTDAIGCLGLRLKQIPAGLLWGVVTLLVLFPLVSLSGTAVEAIYSFFHLKKAGPHELLTLMDHASNPRVRVVAIIMAVVVAPLLEELGFRGVIQTMLGRMFSFAFGVAPLPPKNSASSQVVVVAPTTAAVAAVAPQSEGAGESKIRLQYQPNPPSPRLTEAPPVGHRARWAAIIVTSACFAAIHMEPAFLAPLFLLAVGLGYVYERTGNLWASIIAHSFFNGVQILLFFKH